MSDVETSSSSTGCTGLLLLLIHCDSFWWHGAREMEQTGECGTTRRWVWCRIIW